MMFVFCRKRPMELDNPFSSWSASSANSCDSRPEDARALQKSPKKANSTPPDRTSCRKQARQADADEAGDVVAVAVVVLQRVHLQLWERHYLSGEVPNTGLGFSVRASLVINSAMPAPMRSVTSAMASW